MPYRSSSGVAPDSASVVCAQCATLVPIALEERKFDTFTCTECTREQPVMRDPNALEADSIKLAGYDGANYEQLDSFGLTLGLKAKAMRIDVVLDGITGSVSLSINSGTVVGLDMKLINVGRGAKLPQMRLGNEGNEHRDAKKSGVAREVQVGDETFDHAVYIESSATDDAVRTALSSEAVRKAVMRLLRECKEIKIGEDAISIYIDRDHKPFDVVRIKERLGLLRVIAGAPRPLVTHYVKTPSLVILTKALAFSGIWVALGMLVFAGISYTPIDASPAFMPIGVGFLIGLLLQLPLGRIMKGRSTSHRDLNILRPFILVQWPALTTGLFMLLNGALDSTPVRPISMVVSDAHEDSDDSSTVVLRARGPDEKMHSMHSKDKRIVNGSTVLVGWRSGAFGWTWMSSGPTFIK